MKRIVLGLLLTAPLFGAEEMPKTAPIKLTETQKEHAMKGLFASNMTTEEKQSLCTKLLNNEALTEEDRALLERYNLLLKEDATIMTFGDLITRFFDIQKLGMGIAKYSLNAKGIQQPKKTDTLRIAIKALLIADLEICIKDHKGTLGEFFDQEALKKALKTIVKSHGEGNFDEDSLFEYHMLIRRSINKEAFQNVLSEEEYNRLILPDRTVNLAYLLSLFGFIEGEYHDQDQLNIVISRLLMNESIENHSILNSINLAVILKGLGYEDEEIPDIDGLRCLISQALSWLTEEDGHVFNNFLTLLGDHWRHTTKGEAHPEKPHTNE